MRQDYINQFFNEVFEELPAQSQQISFDYEQFLMNDNHIGGTLWQSGMNYPPLFGSHHSSMFLRPDSIDKIEEDTNIITPDIDASSSGRQFQNDNVESTDSEDINTRNKNFKSFLDERSKPFISNLKHTDFEDGMENDVIREVEGYLAINEDVTLLWMHSIYSNNQKDADILSALLRIIGMTVDSKCADMLLPMVKAGLADPNSKTQEAALMVIEEWRTKNCLDAIETAPNFSSAWIGKYAEQVKSELKEELQNVVATNDR